MNGRNWERGESGKRWRELGLVLCCALCAAWASRVMWSMRETASMTPDLARAVLRDERSTDDQARNAAAVITTDVWGSITDLAARAKRGDQFAAAALRQIRASADAALR